MTAPERRALDDRTAGRWARFPPRRPVAPSPFRPSPRPPVTPMTDPLGLEALEDQAAVGAAEAEGVGERVPDRRGTGFVGHVVEVALRIRGLVVDRRWHDL